ncbi:MAG: respiratory nitrate reductase subunit gamma [Actinomycetota bacterium]
MSRTDLILWVILPYVCATVFVVGHVWRYRRDQFTWTTRSTQLLERKYLRLGSPLFHGGMLAVFGGHAVGILVPASLTEALGVSEHQYHTMSVAMGTLTGTAMVTGFAILMVRRASVPRVRATTSRVDVATYVLLGTVMTIGMIETVGANLLGGGYDYRETVGPWFRGIFAFNPDAELMAGAPLVYQAHALAAWLLLALWPFSRLVHAWSVPVSYLRRSHILYRRRGPAPVRAPKGPESVPAARPARVVRPVAPEVAHAVSDD